MKETFTEWLDVQPDYGLCDPPMSLWEFEDFIKSYLLPESIRISMPQNKSQCRTEILFDILMEHSKKFRKEWDAYKKLQRP